MERVLVIEDDADLREDLSELLKDEGYDVATAANGADALRYLRTAPPPCLILLDLMMPVMSGWDFRAEQLKDAALSAIPVVVVSGAGDLRQHAASLHAADYLAKPVTLDRLFATIARTCPPS